MYGELCTYAPSHIVVNVVEQGNVIRVFAKCDREEITLGEISRVGKEFIFTPTSNCEVYFSANDERMVTK